jgi:hypothetical protein
MAASVEQRVTAGGSYVEPRVSGSVLSISPIVVLFAIFLWTFLWGHFRHLHRCTDHARHSHLLRRASRHPIR